MMETVASEIGVLILENAPDIKSLWAFIRASPRIYAIFDTHREHILATVIARELGPVILREASAAVSSSKFISHETVNGQDVQVPIRGPPKAEALDWLNNYYLPQSDALHWVKDFLSGSEKVEWSERYKKQRAARQDVVPTSEDMWELHKDVKFMAKLYFQETLPVFNRWAGDAIGHSSTLPVLLQTFGDLSLAEKERIFRGIYRFVIFGNLFAPHDPYYWSDDELSELFLCRFLAWQVAEISCIYEFMSDKVLQKWQEMEDHEFNRLAADPELWDIEPRPDPWNCRWDADLFSKSSKYDFVEQQAFVLTLSIKDLTALFQSKGDILESSVRRLTLAYTSAPSLGDALFADTRLFPVYPGGNENRVDVHEANYRTGDKSMVRTDEGKADRGTSANIGWWWANSWHSSEIYCSPTNEYFWGREGIEHEGFRRLGYVFWDCQRWPQKIYEWGPEQVSLSLLCCNEC